MRNTDRRRSQAQTAHVWVKLSVRIALIIATFGVLAYFGGGTAGAGAAEAGNGTSTAPDTATGAWLYPPNTATDENPWDMPIVAISTQALEDEIDDPTIPGIEALLAAGYHGELDGRSAIYAPANLVINVPGGTWTVTVDGLRQCVDWTTTGQECSGTEFLA